MEQQNRDFKGIWIPREIWLDEDLTALDKIILMEINSLDNGEDGCYASNDYLAEFCQCSTSKISSSISKLKKFGYLEEVSFDGRTRFLKSRLTKNDNETFKKCKADNQKVIANNIDNKIENKKDITIINNSKQENKRLTKKQQNYIRIREMIDEFSNNEKVRQALRDYLKVRTTDRSLNVEQWTLILNNLKEESKNYDDYTIKLIEKATACGWMQIVYTDNKFSGKPKVNYSSSSYNDNTSKHFIGNGKLTDDDFRNMSFEEQKNYVNHMALADMTDMQKQFFNDNCLAKDENGKNLVF